MSPDQPRAAIRDTLASYCHTADDGRFEEFALLFAEDGVVTVLNERLEGRAAIREWMRDALPPERRGRHVTANSRMELEGADRARVVSDFLFYSETEEGWRVTQTGRYHDVLVRRGGGWSFARREIRLAGD